MRRSKCVRALSMILALIMVLGVVVALPVGTVKSSAAGLTADELAGLLYAESYEVYAARYTQILQLQNSKDNGKAVNMPSVSVDLFNYVTDLKSASHDMANGGFSPNSNTVYTLENLDGSKALFTPDSGALTWTVNIPQLNLKPDGSDDLGYLYMVKFEYYPIDVAGNVATVERSFSIDSSVPFREARSLSFSKNWIYGYVAEDGTEKYEYLTHGSKLFDDDTADFYYEQDKGGNDLRYSSFQCPVWRSYIAQDVDGFHHGNFYFFLEPGEHTITLTGSRENLALKSITLVPAQQDEVITYNDYLAKYAGRPDEAANGGAVTVLEAEFPTYVSDTSVYPANDRSSAITSPSSPSSQLMNTIGAQSYNTVGQWAAYRFTVNKSGWYNMTMRYRQNLLDGLFVSRTIKLSGGDYGMPDGTPTVPFHEAYLTRFNYSKNWEVDAIGAVINDQATDFKFYFEEGVEYTVYFEVSLGDLAPMIKRVQDSLSVINDAYLNIIKLTGTNPDQYRDYGFTEIMPETIRDLLEQARVLEEVSAEFVELAGTKGSQVATLDQIAFLLNRMGSKESEIAKNLSNLKSYIGTLGTWLNTVKQQGLLMDYVAVQPLGTEEPRENANFFESAWFEIRAFFVSFVVDYNTMGVKEGTEVKDGDGIDVWLATGRDQSLIWRNLIDGDFTPQSGIPVRLKLVAGGTLLPSVLSGQGPDVYIGLGSGDVINYAIRGAIEPVNGQPGYIATYGYDVDLTEKAENSYNRTYYVDPTAPSLDANGDGVISDKEAVTPGTWYENDPEHPSKEYMDADGNVRTKYEVKDDAIVFNYANTIPISLLGKTYGVPETTNFMMMFYRLDVLAELGMDLPNTWDDLLEALTAFQSNNMKVGLTYGSALTTFIYQKGGSQWMYEDASEYADPTQFDPEYAGAQIGLGTDVALDAFRLCARLYTDYSFDVTFDAANRFRTGEMPIIMTDYCNMYNQLTVFATEIRGLWAFTRLPGMLQDDGSINNCAVATLTATIMLYKDDSKNQADAWEYMKWQASAGAQATYGNQMVALVGPAAKYATANNQALRNLSWTSTELASLLEQFDNLAAVPNFPGSYIISRYIEFAFLDSYNDGAAPVEALASYITTINKELTRKRAEFNMKTLAEGETPPGYLPAVD